MADEWPRWLYCSEVADLLHIGRDVCCGSCHEAADEGWASFIEIERGDDAFVDRIMPPDVHGLRICCGMDNEMGLRH